MEYLWAWHLWGVTVSKIWGMQMCCVKVPKTLLWNWIVSTNVYVLWAYLPGWGVNHDQEGGSPRARPFHCTSVGLTPAIISNVDNSTASFLLVGDCVRAIPWIYNSLAPACELCPVELFKFDRIFVWSDISERTLCLGPYHVESTSSRPITEVKQHRAALVLGWVTAWEYAVP